MRTSIMLFLGFLKQLIPSCSKTLYEGASAERLVKLSYLVASLLSCTTVFRNLFFHSQHTKTLTKIFGTSQQKPREIYTQFHFTDINYSL